MLRCRQLSQNLGRQVDWLSGAAAKERSLVRPGTRVDNGSQVEPLLDPMATSLGPFIVEGAYDLASIYDTVARRHPDAALIVPHAQEPCCRQPTAGLAGAFH